MDDNEREKIKRSLGTLVEGTHNFDAVFKSLVDKGMFNEYMQAEILAKNGKERLGFLYHYVTTRGPRAFRQLLDAFNETDHNRLAALLAEENSSRVFYNGNASNQLSLEEQFPDEVEEWIVRQGVIRYDYEREKVYKMGSRVKGLALIINIQHFVNNIQDQREGSEYDVSRLNSILSQLDYKVTIRQNLTRNEILEEVKAFSKRKEHHDCDSSIVFVMSHGQGNVLAPESQTVNIMAQDGGHVNSYNDIIEKLTAKNCSGLKGKPKLFFFQACRGDRLNYPVSMGNTESHDQNDHLQSQVSSPGIDGISLPRSDTIIRDYSDILIGYSTSPGYVSLRDPDRGTWYIQALCRVLAGRAWRDDIVSMLEEVGRMCNAAQEGVVDEEKIVCWRSNSGFNKYFHFHPGLFDPEYAAPQNGS